MDSARPQRAARASGPADLRLPGGSHPRHASRPRPRAAARRGRGARTGVDADQIERVEILWEETLGVEGRAAFYDRTGAVRDVMQNHLLQVLVLAAMELPDGGTEQDLHDAKVRPAAPVREPSRRRCRPGQRAPGTPPGRSSTPSRLPVAPCPAMPTLTVSTPLVGRRRTPRWSSRSTHRGGPACPSSCGPARRWVYRARACSCTFARRAGDDARRGRRRLVPGALDRARRAGRGQRAGGAVRVPGGPDRSPHGR